MNTNLQLSEIPTAKYCLTYKPTGELYFFEVVERKNGRRFVNRLIGAPGDWKRVWLDYANTAAIVNAIHRDVKGAAKSFADQFTCCAKCQSPLSDAKSRSLGLGPDCRKAFGL